MFDCFLIIKILTSEMLVLFFLVRATPHVISVTAQPDSMTP